MDYEGLHTSTLEKLYGPIEGQIIKQDKHLRIIHLRDKKGISRTLGVVRFLNIESNELKVAHRKILNGALLGKTLCDSNIDFEKKSLGAIQVKFPDWLKNDFKSLEDSGYVFFSKILVSSRTLAKDQSVYTELIEIVPRKLGDLLIGQTRPLTIINEDLLSLCKAVGLTEIKIKEKP